MLRAGRNEADPRAGVGAAGRRRVGSGLSVYGALARTVADSALLLDVMHGAGAGREHARAAFAGSYVEAPATSPGRLGSRSHARFRPA